MSRSLSRYGFFVKSLSLITKSLLFAVGAAHFIRFVFHFIDKFSYKYAVDYGEPVLVVALKLMELNPFIYNNLHEEPFVLVGYTPLYTYLHALFSSIGDNLYAPGRLVSFLTTVASAALISVILRRLGGSFYTALMAALTLIAMPLIYSWGTVVSMETTALFFSLAGLAAFMRLESFPSLRRWIWWPALLFFLAFMTKQNALSAACAASAWLLFNKRYKDLICLQIWLWGLILSVCLALNWITDGYFYQHAVIGNVNSFHPSLLYIFWKDFLPDIWPFLFIGAAAPFILRYRDKRTVINLYFAVSLISTLAIAKIGSNDNYFIEFIGAAVLSAFCLAISVGRTVVRNTLYILIAGFMMLKFSDPLFRIKIHDPWFDRANKDQDEIVEKINELNVPTFSENMAVLIEAGREVDYQPFEFTQLAAMGLWDEEKILRKLRSKYYRIMFFQTDIRMFRRTSRYSKGFIAAMRENYLYAGSFHKMHIFVPKKT